MANFRDVCPDSDDLTTVKAESLWLYFFLFVNRVAEGGSRETGGTHAVSDTRDILLTTSGKNALKKTDEVAMN